MCGRKTLTKGKTEILESLFADEWEGDDFQPSWNVAPTHQHPIMVNKNGKQIVKMMQWGLIPSWAKESSKILINARSESLAEKAAFRNLLQERRCLVLLDGYYEWKSDSRQPYYIYGENREILLVAGLWDTYQNGLNYTIVTTEAQGELSKIHSRMPFFLNWENAGQWLDKSLSYGKIKADLEPAFEKLIFHPVSNAVNSVRNNSPELILPVKAAESANQLSLF